MARIDPRIPDVRVANPFDPKSIAPTEDEISVWYWPIRPITATSLEGPLRYGFTVLAAKIEEEGVEIPDSPRLTSLYYLAQIGRSHRTHTPLKIEREGGVITEVLRPMQWIDARCIGWFLRNVARPPAPLRPLRPLVPDGTRLLLLQAAVDPQRSYEGTAARIAEFVRRNGCNLVKHPPMPIHSAEAVLQFPLSTLLSRSPEVWLADRYRDFGRMFREAVRPMGARGTRGRVRRGLMREMWQGDIVELRVLYLDRLDELQPFQHPGRDPVELMQFRLMTQEAYFRLLARRISAGRSPEPLPITEMRDPRRGLGQLSEEERSQLRDFVLRITRRKLIEERTAIRLPRKGAVVTGVVRLAETVPWNVLQGFSIWVEGNWPPQTRRGWEILIRSIAVIYPPANVQEIALYVCGLPFATGRCPFSGDEIDAILRSIRIPVVPRPRLP